MQPPSEPALVTPVYDAGAVNDFQKDKQFRKLNAVKDTIEIKTLRGGHLTMVTNHDLVVGDVVILDAGDKLVADMLMFESHGLVVDEASLTGESEPIKKHLDSDPWLRSGTQVSGPWLRSVTQARGLPCLLDGAVNAMVICRALVIAVGLDFLSLRPSPPYAFRSLKAAGGRS